MKNRFVLLKWPRLLSAPTKFFASQENLFRTRLWICIPLLAVMLGFAWSTPHAQAAEADTISVLVNGQQLSMEVPPIIENGRTLAPVRAIAESLGAAVFWDSVSRRVEITHYLDELVLVIDSDIAYVNGLAQKLDAPARIVDGRTLIPARFISESFHAEVDWLDTTRTVTIATYVDAEPFSAELAQLETAVLQELNQRRAQLARAPLQPVEELNRMARSHAAELARSGIFTHVSPRFGDTQARAAARGLPVYCEYLALGLPDAASLVDTLIRRELGALLLAEETCFWGLGLYKSGQAGNADIYAVAELIEGNGFVLGGRPRHPETPELSLSGYAQPFAPLTLYLLNSEGQYSSRFNYPLSVDGAGRFNISLSLPQAGRYAAVVGLDSVTVIYE